MPRRVQQRQYGTQRTQNRSQRSSLPHRKRKRNQGQAKQEDHILILLTIWQQQERRNNIMKKMHKMPNGKMMKDSDMKHEKTEGPAARMKEYGSKTGGVKPKVKKKK